MVGKRRKVKCRKEPWLQEGQRLRGCVCAHLPIIAHDDDGGRVGQEGELRGAPDRVRVRWQAHAVQQATSGGTARGKGGSRRGLGFLHPGKEQGHIASHSTR